MNEPDGVAWFAAEGVTWWAPETVIRCTQTGDENGWLDELSKLWSVHRDSMSALLNDINCRGITTPVQIAIEGNKRRVVDGHHRIAVCLALQLSIPVEFVRWSNEDEVISWTAALSDPLTEE